MDDFDLIREVADPSIIPAKYGGGDFVVKAWPDWFAMDERIHRNVFAFDADSGQVVGFERCELYGDTVAPDTGWLEALRVKGDYKGHGVMPQLQSWLLASLPASVTSVYLSTASGNARMRSIGDKHYQYLGCYVAHQGPPGGFPDAEVVASAARITCRWLQPTEEDVNAAWELIQQCQGGR